MRGRGFFLASAETFLNELSRRMGGLEEILVASNSTYVQDECSLLVVNNVCFGGNLLGCIWIGVSGRGVQRGCFSEWWRLLFWRCGRNFWIKGG